MRSVLAVILSATWLTAVLAPAAAGTDVPGRDVVMFSTDYGLGIVGGATNGPGRHAADVDDAYALSLALQSADVQAVVTSFGNDKARPSAEAARRGLDALGVPGAASLVTVGAEGFLDAEAVAFVPARATDPVIYCVNDGVKQMRDTLEANERATVTLFAIGPFTDIACLQRAYPDAFGRLAEIVGLVGSADGTPVLQGIDVVDFNYAMDPTALGEVISGDHGVPITFLMFGVTQFGSLTNEVLDGWVSDGTKAQRYYGQASQPHATYWDAIFTQTDGQALFDAHTVYYFLQPDAYVCEDGMLATATVGGYPDTSASTTSNTLVVTSQDGTTPSSSATSDGSTYAFAGPVRGCQAFASDDGVAAFEQAVRASVRAVAP